MLCADGALASPGRAWAKLRGGWRGSGRGSAARRRRHVARRRCNAPGRSSALCATCSSSRGGCDCRRRDEETPAGRGRAAAAPGSAARCQGQEGGSAGLALGPVLADSGHAAARPAAAARVASGANGRGGQGNRPGASGRAESAGRRRIPPGRCRRGWRAPGGAQEPRGCRGSAARPCRAPACDPSSPPATRTGTGAAIPPPRPRRSVALPPVSHFETGPAPPARRARQSRFVRRSMFPSTHVYSEAVAHAVLSSGSMAGWWLAAPAAAQVAPAHGGPVRAVLPLSRCPCWSPPPASTGSAVIRYGISEAGRVVTVARCACRGGECPLPLSPAAASPPPERMGASACGPPPPPKRPRLWVPSGACRPASSRRPPGPGGRLGSAARGTARRASGRRIGTVRVACDGHRGNVNAISLPAPMACSVTAGFDGTVRALAGKRAQPSCSANSACRKNALAALPDGTIAVGASGWSLAADRTRWRRARPRPRRPRHRRPGGRPGRTIAGRCLPRRNSGDLRALPEGRLRATLKGRELPVWSGRLLLADGSGAVDRAGRGPARAALGRCHRPPPRAA